MKYEFSDLSIKLTKDIDKTYKKNNGIYFTPINTIKENLELLKPYFSNFNNVLEPSCGSCEYLLQIQKKYPNIKLLGIEKDITVYHAITQFNNKNLMIMNNDFLNLTLNNNFDLIIGNPPYFVIKKEQVSDEYTPYFEGRPNIFILFIIKCLKMLSKGGILSFVLPKNFLNCLYYNETRHFINKNFRILHLVKCQDNYIDTVQETIIIVIQNSIDTNNFNNNFILKKNKYTIFNEPESIYKLKNLYVNSNSLSDLNFRVYVGSTVWNQNKDKLTDDSSKTLLIYNSDIKNNQHTVIKYKNNKKKNYINTPGITKPMLVVNRGYGKGNYTFEYCLIKDDKQYLIENHLICIEYNETNLSNDKLLSIYQMLIQSFKNTKTLQFIQLYFQNNAINTNELRDILPIYECGDLLIS